jgi:hypothetical protein
MPVHDPPVPGGGDACLRCGTCCRKGGPTLHPADLPLVEDGRIPARDLVTIRAGERVYDNLSGRTVWSEGEMIKVRGLKGSWCCVFYDAGACACRIYHRRPAQCEALDCRAPRALETLSASVRLTRRDVLGRIEGLWEMIEVHEGRCAYRRVRDAARHLVRQPEDGDAVGEVLEMVRYDAALREVWIEKDGSRADLLDFLLGRPMTDTLPGFGFAVERTGPAVRLTFSPWRFRSLDADRRAP